MERGRGRGGTGRVGVQRASSLCSAPLPYIIKLGHPPLHPYPLSLSLSLSLSIPHTHTHTLHRCQRAGATKFPRWLLTQSSKREVEASSVFSLAPRRLRPGGSLPSPGCRLCLSGALNARGPPASRTHTGRTKNCTEGDVPLRPRLPARVLILAEEA